MTEIYILEAKGEYDRSTDDVAMEELEAVEQDKTLLIECECGTSFGTLKDFRSHMDMHFNFDWSEFNLLDKAAIRDVHKEFR